MMTIAEKEQRIPSKAAVMLGRLKWLVGLRLLLASALLGSAVVLDWHERLPFPTAPLYGLLAVTFGLSLVYSLGLHVQRWLAGQSFLQLTFDLALISLLVHFTGGLDSVFPFMYIFAIFAGASITERHGGLIVGLLSSAFYGALVLAEWTRVIAPAHFAGGLAPLRSMGYAAYQVLTHSVAFLAVAVLSSHLSYRLRQTGRELEQRGVDLRNLQTLHQAIVSNISSGLMSLDLGGHIVSFNEAAERITGYTFGALWDKSWADSPFADCPTVAAFFANPIAPLVNTVAEINLRRSDGRQIPVGLSCSVLRQPDGMRAGLVVIFQDLTERKRAEEHLRRADRLAALGQLAANIAHEVRNPLAAISGAVEVLRDDFNANGTNRQLLELVLGEAHRLKLITGQFLDFAKPQSLLFRPCAVRPLLDETLRLLERNKERHPNTTWSVMEHSPNARVLADADQLRQVVWNLCLNAIQAMPNGGELTITVRSASPELRVVATSPDHAQSTVSATEPEGRNNQAPSLDDWVEIAFQDTGRGIPPDEIQRIFDPFFTTRQEGTGLGLAIARKILDSMGGYIGAESTVGTGTVFRVWLRSTQPAGNAAGAASPEPLGARQDAA